MSAEVKLVSLRRKPIAANSRSAPNDSTAQAQDGDTLWTGGKEFQRDVPNPSEDPRWYRVGIAGLQPLEEVRLYFRIVPHDKLNEESYQRYSQYDLLQDDDMVEVAPSETFRFWVVVGGESNKDPSAERSFEVFVQEFAVPVQHALLREVSRTGLRWIPRPVLNRIVLQVRNRRVWQAPELLARFLPWRRTRPCVIELDNLSPLPVTATFHIDSAAQRGRAGATSFRTVMRDPLPAGQRHREECQILESAASSEPVVLRVSADVKLTTDRIAHTILAPKPIEVRRIPWLRCWEPYLSALAATVFAACLLFGAQPWIEPDATVTLVLQKLPKSAAERDLDVTLRLIGSDPPLEPRQGIAVRRDGDRLTYRFKWSPILRGLRWDWGKQYELELVPTPKSGVETEFAHYRMEPTLVPGHFSGSNSIVLNSAEVPIPYMNRTANILIPSTEPPVPFTFEVLDEDGKLISGGRSVRETRTVPVEILQSARNVHVIIRSQDKLRESMDVTLQPGDRHVVSWSITPEAPTSPALQTAAASGAPQSPIPGAGSVVLPKASPSPGAGNGAAKPPAPGAGSDASKPASPGEHPAAASSSPPRTSSLVHATPPHAKPAVAPHAAPGLQLDKVEAWCLQLRAAESASALTAGSKEPDALRFARLNMVKKDAQDYTLVVTPSRDCYIQVYELAPPAEPQPVFGIDPDTHQPLPMSYPGAIARPRLARANVAFSMDRPAHAPSGAVIVLALHTDTEPADDLAALLRQVSMEPKLKDWTIAYAAYTAK